MSVDLDVTWDPNAPDAVLTASDMGHTLLTLRAHPDDPDRRGVVLEWSGSRFSCMSDPNDEAISGHRLFSKGLADVLWAGLVEHSGLIADLERQNRVHPLHDSSRFERLAHHVVLLKECVVEVVAREILVRRVDGASEADRSQRSE